MSFLTPRVHDYVYDSLNRLDLLRQWHDQNANGQLDTGELRAEFDYTVRSDGKRTNSTEKIWNETGSLISDQTFSWDYDNVDRLIKEEATGVAGGDYELDWVYDQVGNRLSQNKLLKNTSGAVEANEATSYNYDVNDRLLTEAFTRTGTSPASSTTNYTYNKTQQVSKTTTAGSVTTTQSFKYNLQGRLTSVINQSSDQTTISRTDYRYDTSGTRVGSTQYQATTSSPTTWTLQSTTTYLTDSQNPTGYSQVLEEVVYSAAGQPTKKTIYTVGHDQISQTTYDYSSSSLTPTVSSLLFGSDGHGSVRILYDAAAAIARDAQLLAQYYSYDAYGNLLSISNSSLTPNTLPLTTYLYSGEAFDFRIGQQYLRARWYDPANGRFTGLDPFAGNSSDPQSFHKYAYVHGDPVNGVDPSGQFLALAFGVGVQMLLPGPGDFIQSGLEALLRAYVVNLEWDVEWALDMSLPDSWGSRLDNDWVYAALGAGLHDSFDIWTPFGTFNPLDWFGAANYATASIGSRGPNRIKNWGGGGTAAFSEVLRRSDASGTVYEIAVYYNKNISKHKILHFPQGHPAVKKTANIAPTGNSQYDIYAANARHGKIGKDRNYDWKKEYGEAMVWHHDVKYGRLVLISEKLHISLLSHTGGGELWYR